MSHAEYVATRDEDQLENLIEQAQARLKALRESGYVTLWEVSIGWGNIGWFGQYDYDAAVSFAIAAVQAESSRGVAKGIEMQIKQARFRPEEAAELIKRQSSPKPAPVGVAHLAATVPILVGSGT